MLRSPTTASFWISTNVQNALTEDDVTSERLDAERILVVVNLQQSRFSPVRVSLLILWGIAWAGFGIPWNGMTNHAHWGVIRWSLIPRLRSIDDAILNFLFYIPLGMLGRRSHSAGAIIALGFACSLTTELIQVFSHTRTPTLLDVVVNTAGTIVGVALQSRIHSRPRPREDVASPQPPESYSSRS